MRLVAGYALKPARLVIVESGALWPPATETDAAVEDTVVIAMQPKESQRALLRRVERSAQALRRSGNCVVSVVLAFNSEKDHPAREEIAKAVLPYLCPRTGILLIAAHSLSADKRHALVALCGNLSRRLGRGGGVRAQFDAPKRRETWRPAGVSGVRICERAPAPPGE